MISITRAAILALLASNVAAFTPSKTFGVQFSGLSESAVAEPEVAGEPGTEAPSSGLSRRSLKRLINRMSKESFSQTLDEIEPFLQNEAGITFYSKSLRRISSKAKMLGATVPSDFAKGAVSTKKRREKQDAFIQQKEEERLAAEAEAAEAPEEVAEESEEAPAEE
mmetsp:Transcript_30248/g.61672  ORF Transcript_30248/g.61672 Transcript_30248/m.61672 type:complete len:166 (-) Transcript_30248:40-537(-)|eukprot:CAMPEP_0183304102 /NCGR_PEP_ID=MMETSP0160_2-20130417/9309_1 /TAXON_ID=2839 ORGANISM="Odontella Sinensis, Strain Grunow 1884" /NCGR_SAMPLE_ID=MMETSP0160_2 /ASSEMBLY_ACC=CAM_ASM_000250 /LENGTH=165 /DNA_ID=CAMNT_0025467095 /DNA_START=28 /DNA_END=525 /DNA_ORIENTATION=-